MTDSSGKASRTSRPIAGANDASVKREMGAALDDALPKLPRGAGAVMNSRSEAIDSLDLFPTPPWATRALFECVIAKEFVCDRRAWDPCAGLDHMADVLEEYFGDVVRSDVFDYGRDHRIGSFVGAEGFALADVIAPPSGVHWVIANPPFNLALEFAQRALSLPLDGFALLLRSNWVEGEARYLELFSRRPPSAIAQFAERVPMVKGRWDPDASTATSYSWFVWLAGFNHPHPDFMWIPYGQREALTRLDDHERFAMRGVLELAPLPLFGEGAPNA